MVAPAPRDRTRMLIRALNRYTIVVTVIWLTAGMLLLGMGAGVLWSRIIGFDHAEITVWNRTGRAVRGIQLVGRNATYTVGDIEPGATVEIVVSVGDALGTPMYLGSTATGRKVCINGQAGVGRIGIARLEILDVESSGLSGNIRWLGLIPSRIGFGPSH